MSLSTTCQLTAVLSCVLSSVLSVTLPCCHLTLPSLEREIPSSVSCPISATGPAEQAQLCLLVSPPSSPSEPQPQHSLCQGQQESCSGAQHTQICLSCNFSHHRVHDIRGVFLILLIIISYKLSLFHCVSIAPLTLPSLPRTKGKFKYHVTAPGFPKILGGREGKVCFSPPMTESPLQAALQF